MGRRAKRSQVRLERTEAGSLDSFDDAFLSCRTESPSSRVSRVTSALHNLCPVHSSSFPAHNSHARMSDARCVVNSVGDIEDGGRPSCVYGGTKSLSTCTRTGVRRPAVEKLASPQQASLKLHVETWAGLLKNQGPKIFREVEIIPGCAVRVACPSCPDYSPEPPGPGIVIRNMLGWSKLEKTERSGVWVFRGALQGENLFSLLDAAGDWVKKWSYHTAWAIPGDSSCSCSYAYGHGPAVGPHTGERCWPLLAGLWRAIAPLMKPWCAEGEVPTAANLNLYRGWKSCVGWHCDDEPLFGKCGDAKLIVSVSLGNFALFRWRRQSCSSNEDSSCRLDHGDILVMDGQCQDEFLHRTSPGREQDRINITFRWVKQHVASCPLFRAGVACCLPTCAQGSSVPVMGNVSDGVFWVFGFLLGVLCIWGVPVFLVSLLCTRLGFLRCASYRTCPFGRVRLGLYLCNPRGEHLKIHKVASMYFGIFLGDFFLEAIYASLSGTAQSPWSLCMYGLFGKGGTLGGIAGKHKIRPLFLLFGFFCLVEILLNVFGVLIFWHFWAGRARHPGPPSWPQHLSLEFFNVGGWLTHGDLALDGGVDFLAVAEHRLIPARVRSEWSRLKGKGLSSIWAPASQESSHVGHAGVGVIGLRGAPLALPTFVTAQLKSFFECGRAVRCMLPLAGGRFLHLCVLYGYQGADTDPEHLSL